MQFVWQDGFPGCCKWVYVGSKHSAVSSKTTDIYFFGQLNGDASYVPHPEGGKSAFDTRLRSDEDFLFEQKKSRNDFGQNNIGSFDVIMSSMIKPEQYNETVLMDGNLDSMHSPLGHVYETVKPIVIDADSRIKDGEKGHKPTLCRCLYHYASYPKLPPFDF